jgi:hypothetical protein
MVSSAKPCSSSPSCFRGRQARLGRRLAALRPRVAALARCAGAPFFTMCCLYIEHPGQLSPDSGVRTKPAQRSPHVRPLSLAPSLRSTAQVRALPLHSTELSHTPRTRAAILAVPSILRLCKYKRTPPSLHFVHATGSAVRR